MKEMTQNEKDVFESKLLTLLKKDLPEEQYFERLELALRIISTEMTTELYFQKYPH